MNRLEGKGVIVTGAARGTGEATARRLVAEGARVLLADFRRSRGFLGQADSLASLALAEARALRETKPLLQVPALNSLAAP